MKIYLSAIKNFSNSTLSSGEVNLNDAYCLESFFYKPHKIASYIPAMKGFLLDSGTFSFLQKSGGKADWLSYADAYADFINQYDVQYFFELDIDAITGLAYVERLRQRIEDRTRKKSIPVWHTSRGVRYYETMVKEYNYVAVGGLANKEIKPNMYDRILPWAIGTAHKAGAKIHGLGFTQTALMNKFHFDSVDSSSWLSASQFGSIPIYSNGTLRTVKTNGRTFKFPSQKIKALCFNEWVKFSKYADENF